MSEAEQQRMERYASHDMMVSKLGKPPVLFSSMVALAYSALTCASAILRLSHCKYLNAERVPGFLNLDCSVSRLG